MHSCNYFFFISYASLFLYKFYIFFVYFYRSGINF